jgi:hypothetical protein
MLSLQFFEFSIEGCGRQLNALGNSPDKRIVLYRWNEFAAGILRNASPGFQFSLLNQPEADGDIPAGVEVVSKVGPGDVLLLNESDAEALSAILLKYLDAEDLTILAPITVHYFQNRPLFLISIPKGGTHLLYRLAEAIGYAPAVVHHGEPNPGSWYCVEYSNSHTVARDFFIDTVRRSPFGNRHHPFPRTPTLFIYRNPLDIVVSEANYFHRDGATVFSSYLRHMEFEQRLLRLIDDPYLLGSIRDRINNFVPWFDCENVIPVSFEELIGAKGGGDDLVRSRLIWSLQLKLHIPGNPEQIGAAIFDESSPTFHEGRIGSSRQKMTEAAVAKFFSLDQDFMRLTGYVNAKGGNDRDEVLWDRINDIPVRAEEFRRRPLHVSKEDFRDTPINVEWNFMGNTIVYFDGNYYALPHRAGHIDLIGMRARRQLHTLLSSVDLEVLKALLAVKDDSFRNYGGIAKVGAGAIGRLKGIFRGAINRLSKIK